MITEEDDDYGDDEQDDDDDDTNDVDVGDDGYDDDVDHDNAHCWTLLLKSLLFHRACHGPSVDIGTSHR